MTEEKLLQQLNENPFVLAPMAGITDCAFRSFMKNMGASIVVTELVSATGLKFSSEKTLRLMRFNDDQSPIGIQLFGEDLDHLAYATKVCEDLGADFVDLNFGCPVPKVVKKGAGSAILKDLDQMKKVLQTVKSATNLPVTIKVRTGWDQDSRNTDEVCKIAYNEGITWVAIHGRTRAQSYNGKADWDYISYIKSQSPIPVLGNGDLVFADQAVAKLKESKCDGVLIGRGCLKNPWIFEESLDLWKKQKEDQTAVSEKVSRNHLTVLESLYKALEKDTDERIIGIQIKKFSAWFSAGYPGASLFRKQIFQVKGNEEILACAREYFEQINSLPQPDTSSEEFLMGGHG